jgi:hypothetical protein
MKNTKHLNVESRSSCKGLNSAPSEYKARMPSSRCKWRKDRETVQYLLLPRIYKDATSKPIKAGLHGVSREARQVNTQLAFIS